jgi:5-formyltetrahydrofolate cyclo-ligase
MDSDSLRREKQLLRLEIKKRLALLDKVEEKNARINAALAAADFPVPASALAAFLPLPGEPDLRPFLEQMLRAGKPLFLPRIDGDNLVFHRVRSLENGMRLHAYGMPEPAPHLPRAEPAVLAAKVLFLVPGLAFDRRGGRLGRGKGYYDRFLQSLAAITGKTPFALGLGFACQIVENLPAGETDFRLDGLATEEGLVFFQKAAGN